MKSILLSVQPKWLEKILNGEKTVEIRKTMPKCELPVTVYLYCTKKEPLYITPDGIFVDSPLIYKNPYSTDIALSTKLSGKVVAKFTLREVDIVECSSEAYVKYSIEGGKYATCLSFDELICYSNGQDLYAWHITDLVVFDKPMELGEFRYISKGHKRLNGKWSYVNSMVTRPPLSWQYVEVEE